jgi:hypothetical protein
LSQQGGELPTAAAFAGRGPPASAADPHVTAVNGRWLRDEGEGRGARLPRHRFDLKRRDGAPTGHRQLSEFSAMSDEHRVRQPWAPADDLAPARQNLP